MIRTLGALFLVAALTVPLSGCIGYLVAKSMEEPKVVTTTCNTVDGKQVCTTVSK